MKRGKPMKRTPLKKIGRRAERGIIAVRKFRNELLKRCSNRDGYYECERCKCAFRAEEVQAHHIKPRSRGGTHNAKTNGALLCWRCHREVHDHIEPWEGFIA